MLDPVNYGFTAFTVIKGIYCRIQWEGLARKNKEPVESPQKEDNKGLT